MRLKSLVVSVPAALGARRAGLSRRQDPDRLGLGGRAAGAGGAVQRLPQAATENINFVYTANGGNAGVKDVQDGTQPVRRPDPPAAPERRRDDLHQDVPRRPLHRRQPGATSCSNISIRSSRDIYTRPD